MTVITMSRRELVRLHVMIDLAKGRISIDEAAALTELGRRQVFRLQSRFRELGADALVSKRRGRRSNRSLGSVFRATALQLVRERYADFGPPCD